MEPEPPCYMWRSNGQFDLRFRTRGCGGASQQRPCTGRTTETLVLCARMRAGRVHRMPGPPHAAIENQRVRMSTRQSAAPASTETTARDPRGRSREVLADKEAHELNANHKEDDLGSCAE